MWRIFLILLVPEASFSRPRCGGTYTTARGIIQTPGFPNKFTVPIHCEWIIEAQHVSNRSSIIVYLTQLFVFEGLTFKEYQIYDKSYQLNGKEIHAVTENNISRVSYLQTYQDYLVITLKLDAIESTHLRVLDHLLDVYGFNITYEISSSAPRTDRCTMFLCGYTGSCYDHYTRFSCECFPGYSGRWCSEGEKSLCAAHGSPACKNGATCTHVGDAAIKCDCTTGFSGETCNSREETTIKNVCDDCVVTCAADQDIKPSICKCNNKKMNNEMIGYFATVQMIKPVNMKDEQLRRVAEAQLTKGLREYVTPVQDPKIIHYESFPSFAEATLRFYATRKDEKKIKTVVFAKWKDHGHIGNISLAQEDISFTTDPLISLQSVNINQGGVIREGGDFILSCVARGSPNVSFRWFKDGSFVNVSAASSYKWTRLIEGPNIKDQYTALLGIDKAFVLDQGLFTCQITDQGIQQCLSKHVEVRAPPKVWIEPMSLTVRKGENFTIKCFSESNTKQKTKFTYSWTKNRILLPITTENEQYEILYPVGSILQVYNINKSTTFSCLVQHELLSSEMGISVNVVYGNSHLTCLGEGHLNVLWPETAAGTESLQECPRGYSGIARRFCSIRDAGQPTWQMPDYSDCMPNALLEIDTNRMKLGYSYGSPAKTLAIYLKYFEKHLHVLPGEGAKILSLVSDVINFIGTIKTIGAREIAISIMQIVDRILTYQHALVRESQVILLQRILKRQAQLINSHPVFHRSFTTLDVTLAPQDKASGAVAGAAPGVGASVIRIPDPENRYPKWFFYKLHLNLRYNYSTNTSATVAVVAYRNLSDFLPARSVIRLKDDTEMEYEILSKIASVWVLKTVDDVSRKANDGDVSGENVETLLSMEFSHPAKNSTLGLWNVNCAVTDFASYGYTWDVQGCRTRILDSSTTRCTCSRTGTFAVLMTKRPNYNSEEQETKHLIVLVGCATCLALALVSCFALLTCWIVRRTCLEFIKIQCCCSITGAMIVFMYSLGGDLPASSYLYIMSFLESFLLTAMSSQLSKLLVVYTEIMQLQRMGSIKQTVVLIITGAPLIAVFGNHLAHRSISTQLSSWWLIAGSLSFNIFIACLTVLVLLFCLIYNITVKKIRLIRTKYDKEAAILKCRTKLLYRSAYVFYSTTLMIFSSIAYINFPKLILCHYLFCSISILLGFVILLCYTLYSEISLRRLTFARIKGANDKKCTTESTSDPLKFYTMQTPETDNDSAPSYQSTYFCKNGTAESHFSNETMCKHKVAEISSPTFKTYASAKFSQARLDCLEYGANVQQFTTISPSVHYEMEYIPSPDILATEKYTELDLVASSMQKPQISSCSPTTVKHQTKSSPPPKITIVTVSSEVDSDNERHQPDGEEKIGTSELSAEIKDKPFVKIDDKLDEMMNQISHDLDYLLNDRDNEVEMQPSLPVTQTLRRLSKPQICVFEQIAEETEDEDIKVPEAITDVSRTEC